MLKRIKARKTKQTERFKGKKWKNGKEKFKIDTSKKSSSSL